MIYIQKICLYLQPVPFARAEERKFRKWLLKPQNVTRKNPIIIHTSVGENFCGINPSAWSPRRGEADSEAIHHDNGKVLSAKIVGTSVRVRVC